MEVGERRGVGGIMHKQQHMHASHKGPEAAATWRMATSEQTAMRSSIAQSCAELPLHDTQKKTGADVSSRLDREYLTKTKHCMAHRLT